MSKEMSDLYVWLDKRLEQIQTIHLEAHGRLRADMTAGFAEIREQFADVFKQARALNDRTLVIEVERKMERRAGIRIGAMWGAVTGALTSALIAAGVRAIFG